MLLPILLTIVVVLMAYIFRRALKNNLYWKKRGVKYPKPLPILGNMLPAVTQSKGMPEFIKDVYDAFPKERYFGIFQFLNPVLVVKDPKLIKSIAIKNFDNFVDHAGFLTTEADPLWSKNLFQSEGDRWRDLRQTLSPVFTSSKMRTMYTLMEECVQQLVQYFKAYNKDVIDIELKDVFSRYTTDVIATTAFGIKCDSLKNRHNEFLAAGKDLADFSGVKRFKFLLYGNCPQLVKYFNLKIVSNKVGNFFRSIIDETIRFREEKNIVRPDLIHSLMLARKGKLKYEEILNLPNAGFAAVEESDIGRANQKNIFLTNEDITAQAVVFFLGGFDTTSTTMCMAAYELAVNPVVQRKLKEEIITTSQKCNGQIKYEELLNMKYLDMVVSETLRKWPQAIWLDRKCTKEFEIKPENEEEVAVKLKVGDVVWFPVWAIHHDPLYYPNPEVFDPERFSDANTDKIHSSTYLPFGIGPRNCIGSRFALLETKILLFYLLRNFDLVVTSKTQIPLKLRKDSMLFVPEHGYQVGLRPNQSI